MRTKLWCVTCNITAADMERSQLTSLFISFLIYSIDFAQKKNHSP